MQKLWIEKELRELWDRKDSQKKGLAQAGDWRTSRGLVEEGKAFALYSK